MVLFISQKIKQERHDSEKDEKKSSRDWAKDLRNSKTPRDFLTPLLSDLPFLERTELIRKGPAAIFKDRDEVLWLENQVISAGHFGIAKYIRYIQYLVSYNSEKSREWCHKFVRTDIYGRWIVQREIFVREEVEALRKATEISPLTAEIVSEIDAYEKELVALNEKYWMYYRKSWLMEQNMPLGPISRAVKDRRKDDAW
ncbi:hypothetical protein PVAR5_2680 [Paecilomyces variotii No. 5]|uniref:Uncharacterized protein n=1 Tax=Byssochlamys spectabilis (strain No. 5 / NBRC 109023) TaxID=1356009 RepID=V5FBJ9_BYSSN|nr:hypothetical protein PVAR5_2680 [Paecilomyces variotii No. 5]